jgi:hypothetical protein
MKPDDFSDENRDYDSSGDNAKLLLLATWIIIIVRACSQ